MNKHLFFRIAILSLVACLLALFSCGNRSNPNLSEKQLQTLMDEIDQTRSSKNDINTGDNFEGFKEIPTETKYQPVRMKTPAPIRIDIVAGMQHVKDITLSEIASDISYVKLEDIPGIRLPGSSTSFISSVTMIDDHFLVNSMDGVYIFDKYGKFTKKLIDNHTEKITSAKYPDSYGVSEFDGVVNTWYNPNKQQLMSQSRFFGQSSNFSANRPGAGFFIVDMNKIVIDNRNEEIHKVESIFEKSVPLFGSTAGIIGSDSSVGFGDGFIAAHYNTPTGMECITFGNYGDTLCRFPIFSHTTNLKRGGFGLPDEMHYYYNDHYTFRYLYNDTIFRILSPNVIQPAYIIDFGKYSLMPNAAIQRTNDLQDNIICSSLSEDNQYVYLRFHQGADNPNNRTANKVKFWWGLYHKASGSFSVLPFNSSLPVRGNEEGITNDIDGGMQFWAQSIDSQGRKIALMSGKLIRETLTDQWLNHSKASSPEKKESLRQFVKTLTDNDQVIVVVK